MSSEPAPAAWPRAVDVVTATGSAQPVPATATAAVPEGVNSVEKTVANLKLVMDEVHGMRMAVSLLNAIAGLALRVKLNAVP